ncbi:MAG: WecB/TagA/CpsF family glycosyltransferase [Candidatus Acidiferrales bacterium]|jgi:N-acetylglucosaminyldiphosphoundecaprenol N-acetyl-beta-D-mannosaminyltransferase
MNAPAPSFRVVGVRVDAIQLPEAVAQIERWIESRETGKYVAITGMHGVAESRQDARFRDILNQAGLVVPDGMPLVWLGRWHGHPLRHRVTGSELMLAFCRETGSRPRHFFYGGAPGVTENLARQLREQFNITVAGSYTPPFRRLTEAEEKDLAEQVKTAAPDVLWVGLSTPKQERWMFEHRDNLNVPVMLGVGAAFDMNSGRVKRAPAWMRENGLEWFYRLLSEPRRLWKRYLVTIPLSMWSISLELFHIRKFE